MRNISPVANVDLFPCIIDRRIGVCRIFQLNDAQGHAVYEQKNIRTACFLHTVIGILNNKLIDCTKDVAFRMLKVDKSNHARAPVLRGKLNTIYHPTVYSVKCRKLTFCTHEANSVHDLMNFIGSQIGVGLAQKLLHIIHI